MLQSFDYERRKKKHAMNAFLYKVMPAQLLQRYNDIRDGKILNTIRNVRVRSTAPLNLPNMPNATNHNDINFANMDEIPSAVSRPVDTTMTAVVTITAAGCFNPLLRRLLLPY